MRHVVFGDVEAIEDEDDSPAPDGEGAPPIRARRGPIGPRPAPRDALRQILKHVMEEAMAMRAELEAANLLRQ